MAVNSKLISQNQIDTSYNANLLREQQIQEQQKQVATPTSLPTENMQGQINTTYQANTGIQYGGHEASWWDEQYSAQADDNSKAMVAKAADYYGYKIPTSVNTNATSYAANVASVQQVAAPAQSEQGATTPVTTNSDTIDSYEEFLRKRAESYKENLDKQNTLIDEQRKNALEQTELQRQQAEQKAEQERQRGVIDARSSYEQNRASYGTNAETLAGMGLTESGYSDYIDSQAYAAQRAETQAVNAQSEQAKQNAQNIADATKLEVEQNASQNKLNAEATYAENMANNDAALAKYKEEKEAEKKAAYSELLSYANNGTYTSEQLKNLGSKYGLSDDDIKNLEDAAGQYKDSKYKENYANAIDNITNYGSQLDDKYLENLRDMDLISEEQYNDLKNKYNNKLADEIKQNLTSGDSDSMQANIDNADKYYSEGKITQEAYQSIYNDYSSKAVSGVSTLDDYNTTKKTLEDYKNSGKLSQSQYNELLNKLKSNTQRKLDSSQYQVKGLGRSLVWTDDIDVYIDGKEYDLVSGHIVDKDSTKRTLNEATTGDSGKTPSVGTVVVVCGEMYIYKHSRKGDNWHKMENDRHKVSDAVNAWLNQ